MESKVKIVGARRERRTPQQARSLALRSARNLLIEHGPNAITLQAVASDLGMSHSNLIHHFDSAHGLQTALMHQMVSELTETIATAVAHFRAGHGEVGDVVNIVFDAFDGGGAGPLAAWMMLSGEGHLLAPVAEVVCCYDVEGADSKLDVWILLVIIAAFGDAMVGGLLREAVGREPGSMRQMVTNLVAQLVPTPTSPAEPVNPD